MAFPTIPTAGNGRLLSTVDTAGGTTKTFPNLSSLTKNSGDLLIAGIAMFTGIGTPEFSSWGASFTEFGEHSGNDQLSIGLAYKFSTGSETGTFTVTTVASGIGDSGMFLLSIAGAHSSTIPESGGYAFGTNGSADPGSLNPANWDVEDTLWIAFAGVGENSTGGSYLGLSAAPTNYSDYAATGISADVIGGMDAAVAFRQLAAASEDPGAFTNDTSNTRWGAVTIGVRPAPAAFQPRYEAINHSATAVLSRARNAWERTKGGILVPRLWAPEFV